MSSLFYEDDVPNDIGDLEKIAEHFGIEITDEDIWNRARQSEVPSHLGNKYLLILFEQLESKLKQAYPRLVINYEVNALASYFNVNNQRLSSLDQLF